MEHVRHTAEQGFTLIELIVTLAILAILITVGVPAMGQYLQTSRLNAAVQLFQNSYQYARAEAVNRQRGVIICPLQKQDSGCGTNWSDGVLVYLDDDGDGRFTSEKDTRLKASMFSDNVIINWNVISDSLTVYASGAVSRSGTFTVSVDNGVVSRDLVISALGRIRKG